MQARELRQCFLEFFEKKGALREPSFPLVPESDPTLLFIVAGMVPYKDFFEGRRIPPRDAIATAQKCLRTVDIEDIGDISHCTLFEMLGNFSFGDYFKKEAIAWAWEFLIDVLHLDVNSLRVTIFEDDDEAHDLWVASGMPSSRITRLGEDKNYWPASAISERIQGPCGPCSEIYFDLQPDQPFDTDWRGDGSRWLEIWNLVFTQFTGDGEGENFRLVPLPKKNIDTGMGLERTAAAINRLSGPFETNVLRPIIGRLEETSGIAYSSSPDSATDIAFRRIADHARAAAFLLADGITPDRTGRGYVLRRLIRRAIVAGIRHLGFDTDLFLSELIPTVADVMGDAYPELGERLTYLCDQVRHEETLFRRTLANGLARLEDELAVGVLSGRRAFFLYSTYGLPFEITREIAAERHIDVDRAGFDEAAAADARQNRKVGDVWADSDDAISDLLRSVTPTRFVGYTDLAASTNVVGILLQEKGLTPRRIDTCHPGQLVDILVNETPFYAESGGQVGDTGELRGIGGRVAIEDTRKQNGIWYHHGTVTEGTLSVGDAVSAAVDAARRRDIVRNHTATHLLHKVLRDQFGPHVQQKGSLVAPDRLRFDFSHNEAVSPADMAVIESAVNDLILQELPVVVDELPIAEAKHLGAMMLFGEKYGDVVRVVTVGDGVSREFCGGTHVGNVSQIGSFRLISSASAAAGVRRIEALTGRAADAHDSANHARIRAIGSLLSVTPAQAPEAVERLQGEVKALRLHLSQAQRAWAESRAAAMAEGSHRIGDVCVVISRADFPESVTDTSEALSALADSVLSRLKSGIVALAAPTADGSRVLFVAKASREAVARGARAGDIVKAAARVAGGGGGGRPEFAEAGGRDISRIADALAAAEATLARQVG